MTTRILQPEEYHLLAGTELEQAIELLGPGKATVIAVFDGEQLVGCWSLIPTIHAEGLWVHPDHRGKSVVQRRLTVGLSAMAKHQGATVVLTTALDDRVEGLLKHIGAAKMPGSQYAVPVAHLGRE